MVDSKGCDEGIQLWESATTCFVSDRELSLTEDNFRDRAKESEKEANLDNNGFSPLPIDVAGVSITLFAPFGTGGEEEAEEAPELDELMVACIGPLLRSSSCLELERSFNASVKDAGVEQAFKRCRGRVILPTLPLTLPHLDEGVDSGCESKI